MTAILAVYKATLHRRAMRYGKTAAGALRWLDKHYTGNSKACFRYQADCPNYKTVAEMQLRTFYKDVLAATSEDK